MVTICPKCGKRAWRPYRFMIRGSSGRKYTYLVYRHKEKGRHTPRKCYVAQKRGAVRRGARRTRTVRSAMTRKSRMRKKNVDNNGGRKSGVKANRGKKASSRSSGKKK